MISCKRTTRLVEFLLTIYFVGFAQICGVVCCRDVFRPPPDGARASPQDERVAGANIALYSLKPSTHALRPADAIAYSDGRDGSPSYYQTGDGGVHGGVGAWRPTASHFSVKQSKRAAHSVTRNIIAKDRAQQVLAARQKLKLVDI